MGARSVQHRSLLGSQGFDRTMSSIRFGRQCWLLMLCGGMTAVLGNALFGNPRASVRKPTLFEFPLQVPLKSWQILDSQALATQVLWNGEVARGWRYRYQSTTRTLNIELQYITDIENSQQDLPRMLEMFTPISADIIQQSTPRYDSRIGFYSLLTTPTTAYLSTCINPYGGSTITSKQFQQNRLRHDMRFDRLLPWMVGRDKLMDNRCLWTMLSLPRDRAVADPSSQILETAGVPWLRWWQAHFPKR
jgi:cyanosortase A-associated protein